MQASLVDHPEEHCELTPQQHCRHKTTLVPRLKPVPECTIVPREVCNIKYVHGGLQGWKFMSCSYCQELGQRVCWLLIGYTIENNQSDARLAQLWTMTKTH